MGKRKRATKPPPKKKTPKLDKIFDCPFCGHEQTVDVAIERDINVGKIECRICGVKFSTLINRLEEEIDVYSKWIDACEDANRDPNAVEPPKEENEEAPGLPQREDEIEADAED